MKQTKEKWKRKEYTKWESTTDKHTEREGERGKIDSGRKKPWKNRTKMNRFNNERKMQRGHEER
jgi:hypothetical protein